MAASPMVAGVDCGDGRDRVDLLLCVCARRAGRARGHANASRLGALAHRRPSTCDGAPTARVALCAKGANGVAGSVDVGTQACCASRCCARVSARVRQSSCGCVRFLGASVVVVGTVLRGRQAQRAQRRREARRGRERTAERGTADGDEGARRRFKPAFNPSLHRSAPSTHTHATHANTIHTNKTRAASRHAHPYRRTETFRRPTAGRRRRRSNRSLLSHTLATRISSNSNHAEADGAAGERRLDRDARAPRRERAHAHGGWHLRRRADARPPPDACARRPSRPPQHTITTQNRSPRPRRPSPSSTRTTTAASPRRSSARSSAPWGATRPRPRSRRRRARPTPTGAGS